MADFLIWEFQPSAGACGRCKAMSGYHTDYPSKPHPNCKCTIFGKWTVCFEDEVKIERTFVNEYSEEIGSLGPGQTETFEYSIGVKVETEGVGLEGSVTKSSQFSHTGHCGNHIEYIIADYRVYELEIRTKWKCLNDNFFETKYEYETELYDMRRECN